MSYKEKDIVLEPGDYWVLKTSGGYEVYKIGVTHSTKCAAIGYTGKKGLYRATAEINRRIAKDVN